MKNLFLLLLMTGMSFSAFSENSLDADSSFVSELNITPNYISKEQQYNYSIYCIKYKKDWMLLTIADFDVSLYMVENKTNDTKQASDFVKYGLEKVLLKGYHKKKNKEKEITDLVVNDYYILKKKGKKILKQLLLVESENKKKKK